MAETGGAASWAGGADRLEWLKARGGEAIMGDASPKESEAAKVTGEAGTVEGAVEGAVLVRMDACDGATPALRSLADVTLARSCGHAAAARQAAGACVGGEARLISGGGGIRLC